MEIIPQIALIFILVFLNGFFVASEFAIVTVRKTRIDELVREGNKRAEFVQNAIKNLESYISAIQLGVTISSLGLGWVGESTIANLIAPYFSVFLPDEIATISAHSIGISISFILITYLLIVLGELIPKTIAYQKSEKIALMIIIPITIFHIIFRPFIFILNKSSVMILKLIGFKKPSANSMVHSEEEIKMILAQSAEEGAIEKAEAEMVFRVLKLGDLPVKEIMIPKTKIIAFEIETPIKSVIKIAEENLHSRFPVYKDSVDNILGFIHIKEIYKYSLSIPKQKIIENLYNTLLRKEIGTKISKTKLIRKILKVSEDQEIDEVLLEMRSKRVHIAVVNDKLGKTTGIITLEDILETLVGDIHDELEKLKN